MSKIKDLYAEVAGIDDLAPTKYDKIFLDVARAERERWAVERIFNKGKQFKNAYEWFEDKAEFGCGYGDEGHKEIYFENFTELCDKAAMELTDAFIEDQHFDMDDGQYDRITNTVGELLADYYADTESEIIKQYENDQAEEWARRQSYNDLTLPKE